MTVPYRQRVEDRGNHLAIFVSKTPVLIDKDATGVLDGRTLFLQRRAGHTFVAARVVNGGGVNTLSRLILPDCGELFIDHINGDPLDNRRANLRLANRTQNARNARKPRVYCTSEYKGVSRCRGGRWRATIYVNNRQEHIGTFVSEIEAALAYDSRARRRFGDFAALNFPKDGEQSAHRQPSTDSILPALSSEARAKRNRQIFDASNSGASREELSKRFSLSLTAIGKIIRAGCRECEHSGGAA